MNTIPLFVTTHLAATVVEIATGLDHGAVPALQQAVLAVVQAARLDPQFALGEQLAATVVQVPGVDPDGRPLQAAALVVQAGDLVASAASLNNYGTLGGGGNLRLNAPALLNERGLLFSGADMTLRAGDITNLYGDVYSLGRLDIARDDARGRRTTSAWASRASTSTTM